MPNQLGRRYECPSCKTVALCTKAGSGSVSCDGKPLPVQKPKKVPSSD